MPHDFGDAAIFILRLLEVTQHSLPLSKRLSLCCSGELTSSLGIGSRNENSPAGGASFDDAQISNREAVTATESRRSCRRRYAAHP